MIADWDVPTDDESEVERNAKLARRRLVKLELRRRRSERVARAATHRGQAAMWARIVTQSRRETWSPWLESRRDTESGGVSMAAAIWKQSSHRDTFGRRMLLQRNFTYGDHEGASYDENRKTAHRPPTQLQRERDEAARLAAETAVDDADILRTQTGLLMKLGRATVGGKEEGSDGDNSEGEEDGGEDRAESDDSDEEPPRAAAASRGTSAGAAAATLAMAAGPREIKEFRATVQLVVLGVTVPGSLVLTPAHAIFAHDPKAVELLKKNKSQASIPAHLIAAPLTWRLDKVPPLLL